MKDLSPQPDSSILTVRAAASRVAAFALLGLVAGAVLFAIETVDRIVVLSGSLAGVAERAELAALLGPTVLGAGLLGLALGIVATPLELVRQVVGLAVARVRPHLSRFAVDAVSLVVAAVVVTFVVKTISGRFPEGLELSVERLTLRFNDRITPVPFAVAHWKAIYVTVIFAFALAIMWAQVWIFRPRGRWARPLAGAVALVAFALLGVCYQFDSRAFFARYEWTIHYPLLVGYTVMTTLAVGFAARAVGSTEWGRAWTRRATAAALALATFGLGCYAYAFVAMDLNQNVKALLWNRSVVARRVYEVSKRLVDRDHDGYSPIFGGGDANDRDPNVHPFAPEVAGNGVDDNCIGGDLATADAATRPRVPAPGEFVPVADPSPAFDPTAAPQNAVDVDSAEAPGAAAAADAGSHPNVIIISVDCERADHTSLFGYGRETTPNLTRYAAGGLAFSNAVPHGTNTGHSFSAMLRSSCMEAIFDPNVPTLTQRLKAAGYHAAFVNARRLDDWLTPRRWHRYRPTMIGDFDVLHLGGEREWTAEQLTDHVVSYVDRLPAGQPQFMWIHYMDVHMPREGHPEYGYGARDEDVYDAEVRYTDGAIGRLLDHLRDSGLLSTSIVFLTADHGEGFMEHGTVDHSNKPYADNSHVPLVVLAPGAAPRRVDEVVGLFDIAPTALAFAGLPVPDVYRGTDLLAAARAPEFPRRVVVSETPRNGIETSFFAWAYVDWPYKYVYDVKGNTNELYDLSSDPNEQHNLIEVDRDRAARMRDALGRWLDLETVAPPTVRAAR
jgi:arylsulfatase A-like enzyme